MSAPQSEFTPITDRQHPNIPGGTQRVYRFENGYGASVVRHIWSYGGTEGLFELAVLKFSGPGADEFKLTYDTPITDDVEGHLTPDDVTALLVRIRDLPQQAA